MEYRDSVADGSIIACDVGIVGTGPAGLSVARALMKRGARVCLFESSPLKPPPLPDDQYAFEQEGLPISTASRVRAFGGTGTVWSGRWKELDAIDFEARSWISYSGWPFPKQELNPYYAEGKSLCEIASSTDPHGAHVVGAPFEEELYATLPKTKRNFSALGRSFLSAAACTTVYHGAHVLSLKKTGKRVTSAEVAFSTGARAQVEAKLFVIATGGIETPRLLLISDIGNEHDQVGRYYMDHPKGQCGVFEPYEPLDMTRYRSVLSDGGLQEVGLRFGDAYQTEHRLLNSHFLFEPLYATSPFSRVMRKIRSERARAIAIRTHLEQEPDPSNRVMLAETTDAFGFPRAKIQWTIGDPTRYTAVKLHEALRRVVRDTGVGELMTPLLDAPTDIFPITSGASHHMGTARMGTDPRSSVVDADGKVHGMENIFVAGSAVFSTGGHANPTATIVALSLRLGEHLGRLV